MNITTSLWEHQKTAQEKAVEKQQFGIFMDMGTGKSLVALSTVADINTTSNLIIAPKNALRVWEREHKKHTDESLPLFRVVEGTVEARAKRLWQQWEWADHKGFILVNYATIDYKPMRNLLEHIQWDCIIADESHHIKAPHGSRSKFMFRLGKNVRHKYLLSGTPLPNGPQDIFGQFRFMNPSIFGSSWTTFKQRYTRIDPAFGDIVGYKNMSEFHRKLNNNSIRITDDVHDLPDVREVYRYSQLKQDAQQKHDQLWKRFLDMQGDMEGDEGRGLIIRMSQLASGWNCLGDEPHLECESKRELFHQTLLQFDKDEPIVVFATFHLDMDAIIAVCQQEDRSFVELSGRRDELESWQNGESSVLIVQIQAGAEGIDLTRASTAIFYSPTYNYGNYKQARKRVHRPGQDEQVTYIHLVAENTIEDDKMIPALERKADLSDFLLNESDDMLDFSQIDW